MSSALYWNGETENRPRAVRNSALEIPATSAAFDCEIKPISYHFTAAARRISLPKDSGSRRSELRTLRGNSMETFTLFMFTSKLIITEPLKLDYVKQLFAQFARTGLRA